MQNSKHFWRGLFFILLIAALCGGLALPIAEGVPVRAAPQRLVATNIVISEFRTRGMSAADEFVELHNPTSSPIDIGEWTIRKSSDCGGTITILEKIPAGKFLNPGQHYLSAGKSYTGSVLPDFRDSADWSIADKGGIAVLDRSDAVIDKVGMCPTTTYRDGDPLTPMSGTSDQSYQRIYDLSFNCAVSNNNATDFFLLRPSEPQNFDSLITTCIDPNSLVTATASAANLTATVAAENLTSTAAAANLTGTAAANRTSTAAAKLTTITLADGPDPSSLSEYVFVSVTVTGGSSTPEGTVTISSTGTTGCTITLVSGAGSCVILFTSAGSKTITAKYNGDPTHSSSTDTEPHQVLQPTATDVPPPTKTRTPTNLPPQPLVGINEFVPRPGHDWNMDGVINVSDEYIELINHGVIDVSLSGYSLDDEVNVGSSPYRLPAITLKPGERRVFYGNETGLLLSDGGDGVRLLKPNGQVADAYNYFVVRFPDQSYCRLPDNGGLDDWNQNCFPTPGLQNSLSGSVVNPPTADDKEPLCPIADTLPADFVLAECLPFGDGIWNSAYWDKFGWYGEKNLPESPGKWPVFVD